MKLRNNDSSPLKTIADIFNLNKTSSFNAFGKHDMSLLTEISDKKVLMDFNWIEDLNLMVSSFTIDDFDTNLLYQQLSRINDNLIIGNLKQNQNKSIIYKHTLPLPLINDRLFLKKYLEDLLSEFNHLNTVLLKNLKQSQYIDNTKFNKIIGHA